jgi:hypothetical protein
MLARLKLNQDPTIHKKVFEWVLTGKIANWFTNKLGFAITGTTIPLPFCVFILYVCNDRMVAQDLKLVRLHEHRHCFQDQQNFCFLVSWAKYLWQDVVQFCKYKNIPDMYYKNKYEVDAYAIQDNVTLGRSSLPDWDS